MTVSEGLQFILSRYGSEVLQDQRRTLALLTDLCPKEKRQVMLVQHLYNADVVERLVLQDKSDAYGRQQAFSHAQRTVQSFGLRDDVVEEALQLLISCLNWETAESASASDPREAEAEQLNEIADEYYFGRNGRKASATKAAEYYRRSAELGNVVGQYTLAELYCSGLGVPQDKAEALKWYKKAAEKGDEDAKKKVETLEVEAKQLNTIADNYYSGRNGREQSYEKAVDYYRQSAELGNAYGQYSLGYMYRYGQGVQQNYSEAYPWLRKAAEKGISGAQYELGTLYKHGYGVKQDNTAMLEWYRKSAVQGFADAQFWLGVLYRIGDRIPQDYGEAMWWYLKAAEQNHAAAKNELGLMYENGYGVHQSLTEAARWYLRSAKQGNTLGMYNTGRMYEYGRGVPQDKAEALKWYKKAAEKGDEDAKKKVEKLEAELSAAPAKENGRFSNLNVGDTLTFGRYPQSSANAAPEPIEWKVLAKENGRLLVISQNLLDCKPFHIKFESTSWAHSTLRKWMNGAFYDTAFNTEEKNRIPAVRVSIGKNVWDASAFGEDTMDKVFLLSVTQFKVYFGESWEEYRDKIRCEPTAYALYRQRLARKNDSRNVYSGAWWLRTPQNGNSSKVKISTNLKRKGFSESEWVDEEQVFVRPAMWISC